MKSIARVLVLAVSVFGTPLVVHADPSGTVPEGPNRSGFTLELGLGLAYTNSSPDAGDGVSEVGLAPLSISLGAFLNDNIAVLFRLAGTSYFQDVAGNTEQFSNGFYGIIGQYWLNDHLFGSAGIGFTLFGPNPILSDLDIEPEQGWGLSFRGGYSFVTTRNHSLRAAIELFPSFYDHAKVVGTAVNFEWQYL